MKVTFLGVGSAFSRKNANSNLLIENGSLKLMVDCSRSGLPALEAYGLSLEDLTHILITHLHADHIGGLEEAALKTRIFHKRKLILLTAESLSDQLWNRSLRGGLEFVELSPGDTTPQTLNDYFSLQTVIPRQWITIGKNPGVRLYLRPTDHIKGMESYGLEVEELPGGRAKRFLFSGDTKFDRELIQHGVQTCSHIFHDCQLFDTGKNNYLGVHASYNQLLRLPADTRRHIWLYDYGDTPLPDAEADGFAGYVRALQSFTF